MSDPLVAAIVVALLAAVGLISYALGQQQAVACQAPVTPAVWHTEAG